MRIHKQFQISDRVFDLAPLVELLPADQPVRNLLPPQRLFELARQVVRAVQNREILPRRGRIGILELADHAGDEFGFGLSSGGLDHLDLLAPAEVGPESLVVAVFVRADDRVRRIENARGRAVVLLELDHLRARKMLRELEDVADVRAAPRIDALVIVADHAEVAAFADQHLDDRELRGVRVLILVDQQIAVTVLVVRQHIGKIAEQLVHQKQHIVEIERILQLEKLLIVLVNRRARLFEAVVGKAFRIGGEQQSVLPLADHRLHLGERESFAGVGIRPHRPPASAAPAGRSRRRS